VALFSFSPRLFGVCNKQKSKKSPEANQKKVFLIYKKGVKKKRHERMGF